MSSPAGQEADVERLLIHSLRDLPSRRAPRTLEERVWTELNRRAALPWWRCGYAHWPPAARTAFMGICVALVGVTFFMGIWSAAVIGEWTQPALALVTSAAAFPRVLAGMVPAVWVQAGLAAGALLYALLFGLGAAAYRALYLRSSTTGVFS